MLQQSNICQKGGASQDLFSLDCPFEFREDNTEFKKMDSFKTENAIDFSEDSTEISNILSTLRDIPDSFSSNLNTTGRNSVNSEIISILGKFPLSGEINGNANMYGKKLNMRGRLLKSKTLPTTPRVNVPDRVSNPVFENFYKSQKKLSFDNIETNFN